MSSPPSHPSIPGGHSNHGKSPGGHWEKTNWKIANATRSEINLDVNDRNEDKILLFSMMHFIRKRLSCEKCFYDATF